VGFRRQTTFGAWELLGVTGYFFQKKNDYPIHGMGHKGINRLFSPPKIS
jgi:hypothetical protein